MNELKNDFKVLVEFFDIFVFKKPISDDLIIKSAGIGGNTFRSLKINKKEKKHPSKVFRNWALKSYVIIKEKVLNNEEYKNIHEQLVFSLQKEFEDNGIIYSKNTANVPYSVCAKLIDLFIEFAIRENEDIKNVYERKKISEYLKENAFVPLDSYTLKAISFMLNSSKIDQKFLIYSDDSGNEINIESILKKKYNQLSMGYINKISNRNNEKEKELYFLFQNIIREIMKVNDLKYPAIYFDKWAWNNIDFQ
jgi:hypothetical protein